MSRYGLTVRLREPVEQAIERTRSALAEQGFGVLTEIDVAATLKTKLGVDVPAQVILGACNPALAHRALGVEPDLGLLLPCNVVVRAGDDGGTLVSAVDPGVLVDVAQQPELQPVAAEARDRLAQALHALGGQG
jgi:uncharacterized protein (DUF302 family)